jgi:hypothetical protein
VVVVVVVVVAVVAVVVVVISIKPLSWEIALHVPQTVTIQ